MSDHIGSLLDAYLDNELSLAKVKMIEEHLKICEQCQNEVTQRRKLVVLLREATPIPLIQAGDDFVLNIRSQLTPRSTNAWSLQSVLKLGWMVVPVGLLLAILFIQTVSWLGTVMQFIPDGKDILLGSLYRLPFGITLNDPLQIVFGLSGIFQISGWDMVTGLIATIIIGITYLSWLVFWWGQQRPTHHHQLVI